MLTKKRFNELLKRERILRRKFLRWNEKSQAFGKHTDDDIRAYCLLVHAEIESYIEEIAKDSIEISKGIVDKHNVANGVMLTLVACLTDLLSPEYLETGTQSKSPAGGPKNLAEWVTLCGKQGHTLVNANNGIKEDDLKKMFRPLGLDLAELDGLWRTEITQLGIQRGRMAHTKFSAHNVPNPGDTKDRVLLILEGCNVLREKMVTACKVSGLPKDAVAVLA